MHLKVNPGACQFARSCSAGKVALVPESRSAHNPWGNLLCPSGTSWLACLTSQAAWAAWGCPVLLLLGQPVPGLPAPACFARGNTEYCSDTLLQGTLPAAGSKQTPPSKAGRPCEQETSECTSRSILGPANLPGAAVRAKLRSCQSRGVHITLGATCCVQVGRAGLPA